MENNDNIEDFWEGFVSSVKITEEIAQYLEGEWNQKKDLLKTGKW